MAITAKQNEDLQKQYDLLRSQGQTKEDATASIKTGLQKTVVENPIAGTGDTAFNKLQTDFKQGGVEGGWIADSTVKPPATTGTSGVTVAGGISTPTQTGNGATNGATTGLAQKGTTGGATTPPITGATDTNVPPVVTDGTTGTGATDTFGNQTGQLTPEELQVYNNMTPAEKQQMKADVDAKLATAANYVQTVKKQKDYLTGQEDINKKITDESGKIKEIQSSERIRNAENQLNNLKQNVAYLGTGGKPGVSAIKMDAISRQLASANTTFQNLKAVESSMKEMQRLGIEFDAKQFEKQMTDLQDDLDNKVSKQIQNAMNEMTSAEMSGKLDTIEEISAFRTKLFAGLDNQISGVAEVNFTQRASILKEYADMETKAQEVIAKGKTIDEKMSTAQGFYVDGNGKAVISKTTGLLIPITKEAPIKPMYDEKTGRLVTFTTDANGKIVASMEDLIQDPTFTQETITNYASLVASGKLKIDDVPESVRTMSGFIDALQQAPSTATGEAPKTVTDSDGNTLQWNGSAWVPLTTGGGGGVGGGVTGIQGNANYNTTLINFTSEQQSARTNRHNNPTAFTTSIAKQGGLVEGVDYMAGDSFGEKGQYKTAMLLGNPIDATIKVIDKIGFKTQGGANRWTYTDSLGISNDSWKNMTYDQKAQAIGKMYQNETDNKYENFDAFLSNKGTVSSSEPQTQGAFSPYETQIMSTFDGKDIKALAKNLGVDRDTAKSMFDSYKKESTLDPNDTIILGSFLKDISGTAVSKEERAVYTEQYIKMKKEGKTQQEIMNQLALYTPTDTNRENQSVKNQLAELQPYAVGIGINGMKEIAQKINNKNYNGAVSTLENAYLKQAGVPTADVTEVGNNVKNGNNLVDRVNSLKARFGPIAGRKEKWALLVKDDKEVQRLLSDMTNFVAKYRNGIAGTSVTRNEDDFLNNIIPEITNNPDNAIAKIQSNTSQAFNGLNTIRDQVGLPTLKDPRSSYDVNFRKQVYANQGKNQETTPTPAPKTLTEKIKAKGTTQLVPTQDALSQLGF